METRALYDMYRKILLSIAGSVVLKYLEKYFPNGYRIILLHQALVRANWDGIKSPKPRAS